MIVQLVDAADALEFGGKAAQLAQALGAGLPVPNGFALSWKFVARVATGNTDAEGELVRAFVALGKPVAVRSSAIGEDSASASFAGQHDTVLNVRTPEAALAAVRQVYASANTDAAVGYRKKMGLPLEPRMGIVVQALVLADFSGVLFTRHPVSGADERVIEAAWGLGEIVVQGLVTPDSYRMARGGRVFERNAGEKDLAIVWSDTGGTSEVEIDAERAAALCLGDPELEKLEALAVSCERAFGGTQDLEWSFANGELFLLQRRAITRG